MNRPETVLLIDDDQQVLINYGLALRSEGIKNILPVQDSRNVMGILEKQTGIGAIILDLVMPHISGTQLLPEIKKKYPDIPVIVVSGIDDMYTIMECIKNGASDYFAKPAASSAIVSGVKKALQTKR